MNSFLQNECCLEDVLDLWRLGEQIEKARSQEKLAKK